MTEKRYTVDEFRIILTEYQYYERENKHLQEIIDNLSHNYDELEKENLQLKKGEVVQEFEQRLLNLTNIIQKTSEENRELKKEINDLKELIKLIADADSVTKEDSVMEILRNTIYGTDSVAGESADAWHDYVILSNFFKEHYKEHWDNDKFD